MCFLVSGYPNEALALVFDILHDKTFNNNNHEQLFTKVEVALQLGKYPSLATDTEVNSCFRIY